MAKARKKKRMSTAIPGWYNADEAANYMDLSPDTVRVYVKRGLLSPSYFGRELAFPQKELDRYLNERRPRGNPEFRKAE
jgi:predicted site-specific integrase-resolvase